MMSLKTTATEETQKEVYARINPLKGFVAGNFMRLMVGVRNIKEKEYFGDRRRYLELMVAQLGDLAKLLCYMLSTPSCKVSE